MDDEKLQRLKEIEKDEQYREVGFNIPSSNYRWLIIELRAAWRREEIYKKAVEAYALGLPQKYNSASIALKEAREVK